MGTNIQSLCGRLYPLWHVSVPCEAKNNVTLWHYLPARSLSHQSNRLPRAVRKRQRVVPSCPLCPLRRLLSQVRPEVACRSRPPSARQAPVPAVQPPAAAVQKPQAGRRTATLRQALTPQRVTDVFPSLDLLDSPAIPQRGQSPEELATRHDFSNKNCANLALKGKWCRCCLAPSSPCMSLLLLLG